MKSGKGFLFSFCSYRQNPCSLKFLEAFEVNIILVHKEQELGLLVSEIKLLQKYLSIQKRNDW